MFQCFNVSLKQNACLGFLRGFYAIYEREPGSCRTCQKRIKLHKENQVAVEFNKENQVAQREPGSCRI